MNVENSKSQMALQIKASHPKMLMTKITKEEIRIKKINAVIN